MKKLLLAMILTMPAVNSFALENTEPKNVPNYLIEYQLIENSKKDEKVFLSGSLLTPLWKTAPAETIVRQAYMSHTYKNDNDNKTTIEPRELETGMSLKIMPGFDNKTQSFTIAYDLNYSKLVEMQNIPVPGTEHGLQIPRISSYILKNSKPIKLNVWTDLSYNKAASKESNFTFRIRLTGQDVKTK